MYYFPQIGDSAAIVMASITLAAIGMQTGDMRTQRCQYNCGRTTSKGQLFVAQLNEKLDFPMKYHCRRLTSDMIALQRLKDGREEPAVVSSGSVVAVHAFYECDSLNEISIRDRKYLVSALSLVSRSVVIDDISDAAHAA